VRNFWAAVLELSRQFAQIPRAGDQVYGFAAGLYPTDAPTLPDRADGPADLRPPDLGGGAQLGLLRRAARACASDSVSAGIRRS
jgi:hypothetical protein